MALFLTLAFLALIITLVLAFFTSVTSELSTARSSVSQTTAKQLADMSVQVVGSVIRMATTSNGNNSAWASQPGMIRTYGSGSGTASSAPLAYFKLYSSDDMEVTQSEIAAYDMAADVDGLWDTKTAIFTDLNSPVMDGAGKVHFPIIDPRALTASPTTSVLGFTYNKNITTKSGDVPVDGVVQPGAAADSQRLPMPVKWIYVLKDGTLTAPRGVDVATGKIANWTGESNVAKIPSTANPIVGRIAFWTDDETSKININTAAGDLRTPAGSELGSFWDSPRACSPLERKLATSQVAINEFQRYPGHPATISLSAVFPSLNRQQIGTLAARTAFGGSQGGTVDNYAGGVSPLARKTDRLYGSVDELLFKPTVSSIQRDQNLPTVVTPDVLQTAKFFYTASSRASELNLFGQPRVCMWPVNTVNSSTFRTASDKLLAFCTTVGGQRYHFTRGTATGASTSTDRDADYAGNSRNQQIYAYLRKLMDKPIPGFGGPANGFGFKYGTLNRDQILTEIFDYIRITNLQDKSLPQSNRYTPVVGATGGGQVAPIRIKTSAGDTKGIGRMPTISEAALQFYATETQISPAKTTKMRAVLILESFCPATGLAGLYSNYDHSIKGLDKLSITIGTSTGGQTLNLKFQPVAENRVGYFLAWHNRPMGPIVGLANQFYSSTGALKTIPGLDPDKNFTFISQTDIDVSTATATVMKLNGATATLTIRCTDINGPITQTVALKFPDIAALPLPSVPGNFGAVKTTSGNFYKIDYNERLKQLNLNNDVWPNIVDKNDTVHSLEPSGDPVKGDLRLVAASESVPDTVFMPHEKYAANTRMAHSLRAGVNLPYSEGTTTGKLVPTATYPPPNFGYPPANPDMPSTLATGALMSSGLPGDWDNGVGNIFDGPYINKPDEGTTSFQISFTYFDSYTESFDAGNFFSPNRQMASPVMLGSLPTGVGYSPQRPWQTLLFRPDVAGTHPGSEAPKDYLLLDLFTMPIVEPYAISEPLSTAGKVNMNYQIAPFTYITRETAVRAALQSIWTMAIPTSDGPKYKDTSNSNTTDYRKQIDSTETLKQFKARLDSGGLFKSPAEVCDLQMVPKGTLLTNMQLATYWDTYKLTGDNTREMPYNHLYPLLTTKSNTYTVHMRVQVLKKIRTTDAKVWDEGRDQILSEHRGSSVIERYVDSEDSRLQSSSSNYVNPDTTSLETLYKLRVLSTKKFGAN